MTDTLKPLAFDIEHMDTLGQGVHKKGDTITFIAKTLPGECGTAHIYKRSKGVQFAHVTTLDKPASNRIMAECPHFEDCPGCHYLHTDYASELRYKSQALKKHSQKLGTTAIELIKAPQRTGYRNRLQLHYHGKTLGLINARTKKIIEIPHCQLLQKELRPALSQLYSDRSWAKKHRGKGHCELYWLNDKTPRTAIQWNKSYAYGGFSQVFSAMNPSLRNTVSQCLQGHNYGSVLDLFAGKGNLSNPLCQGKSRQQIMVDAHIKATSALAQKHAEFMTLDLHKTTALDTFSAQYPQSSFDIMLVDPSRKGFPSLPDWLQRYRPQHLIYVSCHPATLMRDLRLIQRPYTLRRLVLLDMFPSTYHFETVAHLDFSVV